MGRALVQSFAWRYKLKQRSDLRWLFYGYLLCLGLIGMSLAFSVTLFTKLYAKSLVTLGITVSPLLSVAGLSMKESLVAAEVNFISDGTPSLAWMTGRHLHGLRLPQDQLPALLRRL